MKRIITISTKRRKFTYNFRVASPPQSRSQAVVCVRTPRMYPRSGFFQVEAIGTTDCEYDLKVQPAKFRTKSCYCGSDIGGRNVYSVAKLKRKAKIPKITVHYFPSFGKASNQPNKLNCDESAYLFQ